MFSTYVFASISQNQPSRLLVVMKYWLDHVNSLKSIAQRSSSANGVALLVYSFVTTIFTRIFLRFSFICSGILFPVTLLIPIINNVRSDLRNVLAVTATLVLTALHQRHPLSALAWAPVRQKGWQDADHKHRSVVIYAVGSAAWKVRLSDINVLLFETKSSSILKLDFFTIRVV